MTGGYVKTCSLSLGISTDAGDAGDDAGDDGNEAEGQRDPVRANRRETGGRDCNAAGRNAASSPTTNTLNSQITYLGSDRHLVAWAYRLPSEGVET